MSNTGRNLEPVKFGIDSVQSSPTSPDQFGQVYDPREDSTQGNTRTGLESRQDHSHSDVDASPQSQHHTLGTARSQSSPGNHIHDGVTSPKLGGKAINTSGNDTKPALTLTGAKGGNVALTNLIAMLKNFVDFTDNTT
jgi:hypothetical protein